VQKSKQNSYDHYVNARAIRAMIYIIAKQW